MRPITLLLVLSSFFALNGCSSTVWIAGSEPAGKPTPVGPVARLKIPPGHYPPPGQCRVWVPGRPPGRQPRASSCSTVRGHRPPGAWVLYRPSREKKVLQVTAYDVVKPDVVVWVSLYDAKTGELLERDRKRR